MKKCGNEQCQEQIDERYIYCVNHYQPRKTDPVSGQWHTDPIVDALQKINANTGMIAKKLMEINDTLYDLTKVIETLAYREKK